MDTIMVCKRRGDYGDGGDCVQTGRTPTVEPTQSLWRYRRNLKSEGELLQLLPPIGVKITLVPSPSPSSVSVSVSVVDR